MADKVETIARMAQWRIESFGALSYKRSEPFRIGIWNWQLSVEKNRYLYIRLFPEPSRASKEQPAIAKFVLRITNHGSPRKPCISPVQERLIRTSDDFVWPVDSTIHGRLIVDVEFLDLKVCSLNGGEPVSIWPSEGTMLSVATENSLNCLSRMLNEGIHSDVTINTADGTLRAHKAVLAASSSVFRSMFLHNLKEKESSTIDIEDMSLESSKALLSYLYGTIKEEDFWKHRLALLGAANKYDITHLKDSCEESLLEDINTENVLERLQEAWLYQLNRLKKGCFVYLFDFGKIYDVKDEMSTFFKNTHCDLMQEMFQELLSNWKPA